MAPRSRMRPLWPSDPRWCIPLAIVAPDANAPGHLGGRPPAGITPETEGGHAYFATIPFAIDSALSLTIFVGDFEQMLGASGTPLSLGLVEVAIHEPRPFTGAAELASPLSECGLVLQRTREDELVDDEGRRTLLAGHKLGGRPFLEQPWASRIQTVEGLGRDGFALIAQFGFPGPAEPVSGDWPFGNGIFYLFGRSPYRRQDWRWLWHP